MTTEIGTQLSDEDSAEEAGKEVSEGAMAELDGDQADFAVVFCSPEYDIEKLLDTIKKETGVEKLTGCTSAGNFTERDVRDQGTVSLALIRSDDMKFFTGIESGISESPEDAVTEIAENLPRQVEDHPHLAGINLHDGLQGVGEAVSQFAYLQTGVPFAGGSAGDEGNLEATYVFTEEAVMEDAVALTLMASKKEFGFGVGHGHEPISDELQVTEADGSTVHELDGRPAFEVWREEVKDLAEEEFDASMDEMAGDQELLTAALTRYELGIQFGDQYKVRWPGLTAGTYEDEGPMEFAVQISEGSKMRIMSTDKDLEIESPREVMRSARDRVEDGHSGAIIFECFCHAQILGDDFPEAVDGMAEELGKPMAGFESYGEVCQTQQVDLRGYHNTTTSLLVFPD
jgi:hypothetical protein